MNEHISQNEDKEHAIKSPLCAIQMASAILAEEEVGELTEQQRKLVTILVADTERLMRNLRKYDIID